MTSEKSSAKKQYEIHNEFMTTITTELNTGLASFFLKLPIPMTYELWWFLHSIKGDL